MAYKYFITKGRYTVFSEWFYQGNGDFHHTVIRLATEKDEENNGETTVGMVGFTGNSLYVYDTLEEAIFRSGFQKEFLYKIEFENLSEEEMEKAKNFIALTKKCYEDIRMEYAVIEQQKKSTRKPTKTEMTDYIKIPDTLEGTFH